MKSWISNLFCVPVRIAGFGLVLVSAVTAQTFTTLYSFTELSGTPFSNSDGAYPYGLISSGNVLYGAASQGGISVYGTVFAINADGTDFRTLYSFTQSQTNSSGVYTNSDGANPRAGLILFGNVLYGTAAYGGNSGNGTVFAINTDGAGFTNLHHFTTGSNGTYGTNTDGINPVAGLLLWSNTLYGTASYGGSSGNGTVFAINTDGTGFRILHTFTPTTSPPFNNSDGSTPMAGLISSNNVLYGTAAYGGSSGNGTVFKLNTDGTGFRVLHSFTATDRITGVKNDGAQPEGGLALSGSTLYGTAAVGGSSVNGTVFKVNTDGTGFRVLHSFTATDTFPYTNTDGAYPVCSLIVSAKTLYGAALYGGGSGNGTVFSVNTDGTGFANPYNFSATPPFPGPNINSDGAYPNGLVLSGNTLYGTAVRGGDSGDGTIFSLF